MTDDSMSYLARLTIELAARIGALPAETRTRHSAWVCAAQQADGGFAGRSGQSDVYYTSFGLRAMWLLGALDQARAQAGARYLAHWLEGRTSPDEADSDERWAGKGKPERIDMPSLSMPELAALVFSAAVLEAALGSHWQSIWDKQDFRRLVGAQLDALRREDGGFASTGRSRSSGTYHTLLGLLCCRQLELPLERSEAMIELVLSRRRPDGGFAQSASARQSGTNPTAAAVAVLRTLDALDASTARAAAEFLLNLQTPEGGWRAHGRIPLADLLSTFTALVALRDLKALEKANLEAARSFVASLECPQGGFRGVAVERAVDVEYTFYGLGSLALLTADRGEPSGAAGEAQT